MGVTVIRISGLLLSAIGKPENRKTGKTCQTCRTADAGRVAVFGRQGASVKPAGKRPHATPHEKGAAVDMYYDGVSYRRTAENIGQYFGRETSPGSVYAWVRDLSAKADEVLRPMKVTTGDSWVADELVVNVGGKKYWLFNVMDSETRFVLAAYLFPFMTARADATALSLARERATGVEGAGNRTSLR